MKSTKIIALLILLSFCAKAQNLLPIAKVINNKTLIGKFTQFYIEENTYIQTPEQLDISKFKPNTKDVPNFNLTNKAVWLQFKIPPLSPVNKYLLEIANPLCDSIDFFRPDGKANYTIEKAGDMYPFKHRNNKHVNFIFNLENSSTDTLTYYLRIVNHEQFQLPIFIGPQAAIIADSETENIIFVIFSTILIVMFLYNLFIYSSTRDSTYLLYTLYIACVFFTQLGMRGYAFKAIWPNNLWLQQHSTYIFSSLVGITSLFFFRGFIGRNNLVKLENILIDLVIGGYTLCLIVSCFDFYKFGYILLQGLALIAVFLAFTIAVKASIKKIPSANYYLIAWILFMVGILLFVAKDLGFIAYSPITINTLIAGIAAEVVLLSFALANRINILQKEKAASQQKAFDISLENEKILSEQNITLEKLVKDRTIALEQTLDELKRSEIELINKEKMSSLGVLTAGIAHEINNPINFITSGIKPLKRDFNDLILVLNEYTNLDPNANNSAIISRIKQLEEEKEIPFIMEEIALLMNGIEDGANRTATIVKGLQKFSRTDQNNFKEADIIDGLENTLTLLGNLLRNNIQIIKQYDEIPFLYCSIGRLNQVFLNLLTNAIHAVNANGQAEKKIEIKIMLARSNSIHISIADNGIGIPAEIQSKVFDPFFTTKEVGAGTGLGLAITQGIIKDHNGSIEIESEINIGTTVTISLPLNKA